MTETIAIKDKLVTNEGLKIALENVKNDNVLRIIVEDNYYEITLNGENITNLDIQMDFLEYMSNGKFEVIYRYYIDGSVLGMGYLPQDVPCRYFMNIGEGNFPIHAYALTPTATNMQSDASALEWSVVDILIMTSSDDWNFTNPFRNVSAIVENITDLHFDMIT